MTDLMISATFTKNVGEPALGLVLAEIDMWLTAIRKDTLVDTVIWTGAENPTEEGDNVGVYARNYALADMDIYHYFASAHYTGATVLDQDWLNGGKGIDYIPLGTAQEHPYRVWGGTPQVTQEGVKVWFYNDTETVVKWYGVSDMNGWALDSFGNAPRLDPGTYKVYRVAGWLNFDNPDTEVVT